MNPEIVTAAPAAPKAPPTPKAKKKAEPKRRSSATVLKVKAGDKKPKPDPALAKLDADLARSKKRLSQPTRPLDAAPAAKKAPAKAKAPKKPAGNTYATLATAHSGPSTIEHPVQAMWELCGKMTKSRRKDVIAKAVEMGIGYYTARTQYQLWLTAFRNS